jgi:hypothetical protein
MTDADASYNGVFGAFPYAYRRSDSRLFRLYTVVGALAALLVTFAFLLALFVLIANTAGTAGGTFTFSRAFFVVIALAIVGPLIAPILLVARHHRREGGDARYDAALAVAGFLFIGSLYLGLVASVPACFILDGEQVCRDAPSGLFAPVIAALYAVPSVAAVLIPAAAAVLILLVHRALSR